MAHLYVQQCDAFGEPQKKTTDIEYIKKLKNYF